MSEPQPNTWRPRRRGRRFVIAGTAAAVLVGGGAALAATTPWNPTQERQAVINDAAGRLGVQPTQLSNALTQALIDRVNQAVKDGQLTQTQANALIARIKAGDVPLVPGLGGPGGPGGGGGFGWGGKRHFGGPGGGGPFGGSLTAAASYLGLTQAQLQTQLKAGKTLEQLVTGSKTVAGLKQAMHDSFKTKLDAAVKAGKITQAQEDQMLKGIDTWIAHEITENMANEHHGWGDGSGPPPGAPAPGSSTFTPAAPPQGA